MKNLNKNILYWKSNLPSENKSNTEMPKSIFRQELITWSYTRNGIKKSTLVRNFSREKHIDSFTSEPIIFEKDPK